MQLADKINLRGIGLGWHTVFTRINRNEIPEIYRQINVQKFNYWRIYEYNFELARQAWLKAKWLSDEDRIKGYLRSESLVKLGTSEKGGTDSLSADFLRMEEKITRNCDPRVTCVARLDSRKEPYAFLMNNGQVDYYAWYTDTTRRPLGNVLEDGFAKIAGNWKKIKDADTFDVEDWLEVTSATPLWMRLEDGAYFPEEYDNLSPKYRAEVERLSELWERRNKM